MHLVNDVQTAFLQLQAECEKLADCNRNLLKENREKESRIQVQCGQNTVSKIALVQLRHSFLSQELLKNMKELEEKKADKRMVEREIVRGFF